MVARDARAEGNVEPIILLLDTSDDFGRAIAVDVVGESEVDNQSSQIADSSDRPAVLITNVTEAQAARAASRVSEDAILALRERMSVSDNCVLVLAFGGWTIFTSKPDAKF